MTSFKTLSCAGLAALGLVALGAPANAQYVSNTADIPSAGGSNNSETENVDFGDVDLDGDWDAVFADGGDGGNDQNRIWINQGGLQGGTIGVFVDNTEARLPAVSDDSRDVEFADIDNDGDLDLYVSNTSQITNQSNHWLVNNGNGFYTDDTAARWVNLGTGSSSVANGLLLGGGGFVDWSCDCDFGDLDNDGDLDLVHSTYGANFGGFVPTRLFLNDGAGFFEEFNPSGFQLSLATMMNGDPAIWAEGTFQSNTTNTTGLQSDICTNTLDVDLGDTDGDFDLDLLHGDRDANPRFFFNRLEENGGVLARFRDVSNAVFTGGDWATTGNYEQEMGDSDGDGDLDLYGLNWNGFTDIVFENDGTGTFINKTDLSGSGSDDNEGDYVDYDNDGDMDIFVANFSGSNRLYRNNNNGGGPGFTYSLQGSGGGLGGGTSLDADAADVDKDGDYDIFVAQDGFQANLFLENTTQTPDTHAPYIPAMETTGNQTASATPIVIRAQVYDNAPYYITWYNPTVLEVEVDGISLPDVPMHSSAGQIFRGELPGNLLGTVTYRVRSQDEYGNSGTSASDSFVSSTGLSTHSNYSFGGAAGSEPEPSIRALSAAFPESTLYVGTTGMNPSTLVVMGIALAKQEPPITTVPTFTPVINIASVTLTLGGLSDANGDAVFSFPLNSSIPNAPIYFQSFTSDMLNFSEPWAASDGLEVILNP